MIHRVEYTERSRRHLLEAVEWIAIRAPMAAKRWLDDLEEAVSRLQEHPERFRYAPENEHHDVEIRQLLFGKRRGQYRILFTVEEERVVILDVRHSMCQRLGPGELDS